MTFTNLIFKIRKRRVKLLAGPLTYSKKNILQLTHHDDPKARLQINDIVTNVANFVTNWY